MGKLVKDMTPEERERRRARDAAYRAAHREEIRANKAAHREEIRASDAAYRAAHREERRAYAAAYRAAHRDERRAYLAARISDEHTRRTNARMARLGFAFADPDAIVAAIGNAVRKNKDTKKTKSRRKVSA